MLIEVLLPVLSTLIATQELLKTHVNKIEALNIGEVYKVEYTRINDLELILYSAAMYPQADYSCKLEQQELYRHASGYDLVKISGRADTPFLVIAFSVITVPSSTV